MTKIVRSQGTAALKCVLAGNTTDVHITGAEATDSTGNSQDLTVSEDQQSFTMPLSVKGEFVVTAEVDQLPAGTSPELRVDDDNTLLDLFDDPATLSADFQLAVIA